MFTTQYAERICNEMCLLFFELGIKSCLIFLDNNCEEEEGPSKCLVWSIGLKGVENYVEKEF